MSEQLYFLAQTRGVVQGNPFFSSAGKGVLKFRMETRNHKGAKTFPNFIMFGELAEKWHDKLEAGQTVHVQGSYNTSSYTDKDGIKRESAEILVDKLVIEKQAEQNINQNDFSNEQKIDIADDDLPF